MQAKARSVKWLVAGRGFPNGQGGDGEALLSSKRVGAGRLRIDEQMVFRMPRNVLEAGLCYFFGAFRPLASGRKSSLVSPVLKLTFR